MRDSICIASRQALYRVFVSPSLAITASTRPMLLRQLKHNEIHQKVQLRTIYKYQKTTPVKMIGGVPEDPDHPLDENIGLFAHLVSEDGIFNQRQPVSQLLRRIDRSTQMLRQVSLGADGTPVCKVVSKQQLRDQAREKAKPKKSLEDFAKQVEITWAMTQHDLGYRLKRIADFLQEGRRVEVMIAPKRGGRKITRDEAMQLLEDIRKTTESVEVGVTEYKAMEGNLGGQVTLHFRSNAEGDLLSDKKEKRDEGRDDRKKSKEQEKLERKEKEARRLEKKREREEEKAKLASSVTLTSAIT